MVQVAEPRSGSYVQKQLRNQENRDQKTLPCVASTAMYWTQDTLHDAIIDMDIYANKGSPVLFV